MASKMSKKFQVGDLVWGKIRGSAPWPGKIALAPVGFRSKKNCYYMFFFGTDNFGWVDEKCIERHNTRILKESMKSENRLLKNGIETIMKLSKEKCERENQKSKKSISEAAADDQQLEIKDMNNASSSKDIKQDCAHCYAEAHPHTCEQSSASSSKPRCLERPESSEPERKEKNILPTKKVIGFLGLTEKGKAIIKNLSKSGHSIIIWSEEPDECKKVSDDLNVKTAATIADVIQAADITFSCFSSYSEPIFLNIQEAFKNFGEKKGYVEMTPMEQLHCTEISSLLTKYGASYLEAPLCGSSVEAAEGTLFIATAGDKTLYEDCNSCFEAISIKHSYHGHEVGSASQMNIIHNMFNGAVYAALAESMSLLEECGQAKLFAHALKRSDLNGSGLVRKAEAMAAKNFEAETSVTEMLQNFSLGLQLADTVDAETNVLSSAKKMYQEASMMNYGNKDVSSVIEVTKP